MAASAVAEEVNSLSECVIDDFARNVEIGFLTEHHTAQHDRADVHAGASE
jgi:hypothetical protein